MNPMKISESRKPDTVILDISGVIDESSTFPHIIIANEKTAAFVCTGITLINSVGIRSWIEWLATFPYSIKIVYAQCPRTIVDQINIVDGFLPKNGAVLSFYVPYYCEDCRQPTNVLYTNGKEFKGSDISAPETMKCSKCGKDAELDVIESKYFKFLKDSAA